MSLDEFIGKKVKVRVIEKINGSKYYVAQMIKKEYKVYIVDEGDYEEEELIGVVYDCVITDVVNGKLIGFLMTNRKFVNDLKKIDKKLKGMKDYRNIRDIYLVERLKIKGKVAGLYLVDYGEVGKYFLNTTEIGTFYKRERENNIIFKEKTIEDELKKQIRDVVQSIDLNKKEVSLMEEDEKQRHLIEKALGLSKEEMIGIAFLDLSQRIDERDKLVEQQSKNIMKQNEIIANNINKKVEYSTERDVNIKQNMEMGDMLTDTKTLGQLLDRYGKLPEIEGKKITQMGVIESIERDNLVEKDGKQARANTGRYSFVAIASDGTVVPMELEQDHQEGTNPRETTYQVDQEGKVSQHSVSSRFNIGDGTFAIKNGQYGRIQVYHSPRKTIGGQDLEGNKSLDRELETDNTWRMRTDVKELAGEYKTGYRSVEKGYQEAKKHENEKGEILEGDKLRPEDIDGKKHTKSHSHYRDER